MRRMTQALNDHVGLANDRNNASEDNCLRTDKLWMGRILGHDLVVGRFRKAV